ncbi:MAG: lipoprotein signal peptidase [Gammaproteobacteria bacterium]|nr:MAG: lipoprotein signal peptidase [Gammaproteobacteria bacterium]
MPEAREPRGMVHWLVLSIIVFALDWLTKQWASSALTYGEPVPVVPFFNLTLLHNTGAAFSFLAGESGWQRWFFVVLAVGISVMLVVWLARLPRHDRWMAVALSLVLGGALGNLYDRVLHGYVVDFIHLYYDKYHFPAFNIADMAITAGAVMIALDVFRTPGHESKPETGHE